MADPASMATAPTAPTAVPAGDGSSEKKVIQFSVPSSKVGFIIGRGGTKIQSIRDQTGSAVKIHDSVDGQERIVEFTGTEQQVHAAHALAYQFMMDTDGARPQRGDAYAQSHDPYKQHNQHHQQHAQVQAEAAAYQQQQQAAAAAQQQYQMQMQQYQAYQAQQVAAAAQQQQQQQQAVVQQQQQQQYAAAPTGGPLGNPNPHTTGQHGGEPGAKRVRVEAPADGSVVVTLATVEAVVAKAVKEAPIVDVHTHLFPPEHGDLMLWGIDELLTYHYLVAEFFTSAPMELAPEEFFALPKPNQAELVWQALFVDRAPVSEATRGVVTVLVELGLAEQLKAKNLIGIREWFSQQDPVKHAEKVFAKAGIRYAVMTNIPFDATEAVHWKPEKKEYSNRFRSALRIDPLVKGDWETICTALSAAGFPTTAEGAKSYLADWIETMKPEYLMASTPHDFAFDDDPLAAFAACSCIVGASKKVDMSIPGAFGVKAHEGGCQGTELSTSPDAIELMEKILIPVAEQHSLPIAIKIGAHRQLNPELGQGGDGMVTADITDLARMLKRYPKVKFLATFLSKNNQHEAIVLANKFRNLHIYGCWWYCNNPSIIKEVTTMRLEMLGFAFTAQHSDSRVLEQLLYKWAHARRIITEVVTGEYTKLVETGWQLTGDEVTRDVRRLLGEAYHEFMTK